MKKIIIKPIVKKIITFVGVLGASAVASFIFMPNRVVMVNQGESVLPEEEYEPTYLDMLMGKFGNIFGGSGDDELPVEPLNLCATFNDLEITWPNNLGVLDANKIKIDGDLDLNLKSLEDVDFTLELQADFNSEKIDLGIGYVEEDFYLASNDVRIKSSHTNTSDMISYIKDLFFNPENPNGLGINLDVESIIGGLTGGLNLEDLMSGANGFSIEEELSGEDANINLAFSSASSINEDGVKTGLDLDVELKINLDAETISIKGLDIIKANIGDAKISGKINCAPLGEQKILKLDDPLYPVQRGDFIEIINYIGVFDKILNILDSRQIGFDLNAEIKNIVDGKPEKLLKFDSAFNIDFSSLIDFKQISITGDGLDAPFINNNDVFENLLKEVVFDASLSLEGKKDEEYANLSLAYLDQYGYLTLNENKIDNSAVMRTKIHTDTVNQIIEKIPDFLESIMPKESKSRGNESNFFDFITSSEFVAAIKDGKYEAIFDFIKRLENKESTIELDLDLSKIGFGDNALLELVLDCSKDLSTNLLSMKGTNVLLGETLLDIEFIVRQYSSSQINFVKQNESKFFEIDFATGILDQASQLINEKKAVINIEGSVLDSEHLGVDFNGWALFDANEKYGYGTAIINEIKEGNKVLSHEIDIDVDDSPENIIDKNVLFQYGPNDEMKGKFNLHTLTDIFDLVMELTQTEDSRFDKFLDPLKDSMTFGLINTIINEKDYIALAKNDILKEVTYDGATLQITICGKAFEMVNDIKLFINFIEVDGEKHIESLEIKDFRIDGEKTINVSISLLDFEESFRESPVDKNADFIDFSQIKLLLQFGITTTRLSYYHLTAKIHLYFPVFLNDDVDLDFYVHVNGNKTKVYGVVKELPKILIASNDYSTKCKSEFVFEQDETVSNNEIGGYFHILRTEYHSGGTERYYYKSDSSNFMEYIMEYLLGDVLNLRSFVVNSIGSIAGSSSSKDPQYYNLFAKDGFKFNESNNSWDFIIRLSALTGSSQFGDLNLTLFGSEIDGEKYFNKISLSLTMVDALKINGDINLIDIDPSVKEWPSNIDTAYQTILNIYRNFSDEKKADFDKNYLNQAMKEYKL